MQSVFRVLVLTDLVDSTRLVTEVGDARAAELNIAVDRICRDLLEARDGLEIDKTDGFLLLFDSGSAALGYALDLHEALAALSEQEGLALKMRVGLHAATVGLRENPPEDVARGAKPIEVEGLAKPLAARVMSLAVGNQVLCTEAVGRAIDGHDDVDWVDHGHWRLKGVAEPIRLLEVGKPGLAPLKPPPDSEKAWRAITGPLGRQRETLRKAWAVPAVKAIVAALGLAAVGAGIWRWDQSRIKVTMHPELVWRHGAPDGVGTWQEGMLAGYRVTRQGGRVQRVEPLTAAGVPLPLRSLTLESLYNGGLPGLDAFLLVQPCLQPAAYRGYRAFCGAFAPEDATLLATSLVPRYDDDGRVTEVVALDVNGDVKRRRVITHDEEGLWVAHQTPTGLPLPSVWQTAFERHRLDENGFLLERTGQTRNGSPMAYTQLGYHTERTVRDAQGRVVERVLLDEEGQPIAGVEANRFRTTRDSRGLPVRVEGLRGEEPAPSEGCYTRELEWDEAGRLVRETCMDAEDTPVFDEGHCAIRTYRYQEGGAAAACLDPSGAPTASGAGWATFEVDLGPTGHPVEFRFADAEGEPTPVRYHKVDDSPVMELEWVGSRLVARWDDRGLLMGVAFFYGEEPQPVNEGFSAWDVERDERGWVTGWQAYGVDGEPLDIERAVSRLDLVRDEDQHVTEARWLDARGEPTISTYGYHLQRITYRMGLPAEWSFYGVDGEPLVGAEGWHRKTVEQHDDQGNPLGWSFWGIDGEPIAPDGYHLERLTYGPEGWVDSFAYFDTRRQPTIGEYGCATVTQEGRPGHGHSITRCFGPDGEPMWSPYYRAAEIERSIEGRVWHVIRRGVDGEVLGRADTKNDERNLLIEEDRFDAATGERRIRYAYDERGHMVRGWYVGDDDELAAGPGGWAELRRVVDERGNPLSDAWFDADGQPMNRPGFGYHEQRATFDGMDRALSLETFDAEGNPALDRGTFGQRYTYDARGNLVSFTNLLPEGSTHWTRVDRSYDAFGRPLRSRAYDAEGRLHLVSEDGTPPAAGVDIRYDARGRVLTKTMIGEEGRPTPCPAGFSEVALTWEDEDRALRVEYRHDGRPVLLTEGPGHPWWGKRADRVGAVAPMWQEGGALARELRGVAGLRVDLDLHGRVVGVRFLGPDGGPTVAYGVAGFTQTWNAVGEVSRLQWQDVDGAPAVHAQLGWATQELVAGAPGEEATEILRDAEGREI